MTAVPHPTAHSHQAGRLHALAFAPTESFRPSALRADTPLPRLERPAGDGDAWNLRATQLLECTRHALEAGNLDGATRAAEQLLEVAARVGDSETLRLLAANSAWLSQVFEARIGPLEQRIEVGIAGLDPAGLDLSERALYLVELAQGGTTVRQILSDCGFPRRQATRMLAGLLCRRILVVL